MTLPHFCINMHTIFIYCGVIAQLGERLHGMQEVRGSIPRSSTSSVRTLRPAAPASIPVTCRSVIRPAPDAARGRLNIPCTSPAGRPQDACGLMSARLLSGAAPPGRAADVRSTLPQPAIAHPRIASGACPACLPDTCLQHGGERAGTGHARQRIMNIFCGGIITTARGTARY